MHGPAGSRRGGRARASSLAARRGASRRARPRTRDASSPPLDAPRCTFRTEKRYAAPHRIPMHEEKKGKEKRREERDLC